MAALTDRPIATGTVVVADKGYHRRQVVLAVQTLGLRSYIAEPKRGRQQWLDQAAAHQAVDANRRRGRTARGKRLQRRRGEFLERPFAHLFETGGMRRVHLRGHANMLKRLLVHASGFNLGLWMRHRFGVGTPRGLQGRSRPRLASLVAAVAALLITRHGWPRGDSQRLRPATRLTHRWRITNLTFTTGC